MMSFRTGKKDKCKMYNTLPCNDARQFLTDPGTYTKAGVIGAGLLTVLCPPVAAAAAGYGATLVTSGAMLTQVAVENGLSGENTAAMCSSDLQATDVQNTPKGIPMVINVNGNGPNGIQLVFPDADGTRVRAVVPLTVSDPIPCFNREESEEGQRVTLKVFNARKNGDDCQRGIQQAVVVHKYGGLEPSLHLLSYGRLRKQKFRKGLVQTKTRDRGHRDWWLVAYTTMAQPCVVKATVPHNLLQTLVNMTQNREAQKKLGVSAAVAGTVAAADLFLNQYVGGTNVVGTAMTVAKHGYQHTQSKGVIGDSDQAENLFGPLVRSFLTNDGNTDEFFACDFEDLDADSPVDEQNMETRGNGVGISPTIRITDTGCGDGIAECVQFKFLTKKKKTNQPRREVRCVAPVVNLRCATQCDPRRCEGIEFHS